MPPVIRTQEHRINISFRQSKFVNILSYTNCGPPIMALVNKINIRKFFFYSRQVSLRNPVTCFIHMIIQVSDRITDSHPGNLWSYKRSKEEKDSEDKQILSHDTGIYFRL